MNDINNQLIEIHKLLSRVDSTTVTLAKGQDRFAEEIANLHESMDNVNQRLIVIETLDIRNVRQELQANNSMVLQRMQTIESKVQSLEHHKSGVKAWVDSGVKCLWTIAAGYVLYKLGVTP